ncbi:MAG: DUF433 domain-containing protein [Anaerolineae bacterium]
MAVEDIEARQIYTRLISLEAELRRLRELVKPLVEDEWLKRIQDEGKPAYDGLKIEYTDHPHIVKVEGVVGGEPVIFGHRIPVRTVVEALRLGMTPKEFAENYHLDMAQVYDAIAYYYDHTEEMERYIEENKIENVMKKYDLVMDERGFLYRRGKP